MIIQYFIRQTASLLSITLLFTSLAYADEFDDCTLEMTDHRSQTICQYKVIEKTEGQLNELEQKIRSAIPNYYEAYDASLSPGTPKDLRSRLTEDFSKSFEVAVEAFRRYSDTACENVSQLTGTGNGSVNYRAACKYKLISERIDLLNKTYMDDFKFLRPNNQLQPTELAPL